MGQAIQPLVDRIVRLEEVAVSNDQSAGFETAEDPQENSGNTGEDGKEGATGSLPLPSKGNDVGTSGSNNPLFKLLAWIRKLRPQA